MKLIRSAKEAGVSVAAPVVLKEGRRFASERLSFLEHWFPCIHQPEYQGEGENGDVEVMHAPNPYEEVRFAAAKIVNMVRSQGLTYNQIALIARKIDPYLTAIEDIFPKYNIPFFFDFREDVQSIPVFSLVFLHWMRCGAILIPSICSPLQRIR